MVYIATHARRLRKSWHAGAYYKRFNFKYRLRGRCRAKVSGSILLLCLREYGQILGASYDNLSRGWSFDIMLTRKAFLYFPNCMDVGGLKLSVIVTGSGPTCYKCRVVCHLSSSCPEEKISRNQALNLTPNLNIYPVIPFWNNCKKLIYSLIPLQFPYKRDPSLFRKNLLSHTISYT